MASVVSAAGSATCSAIIGNELVPGSSADFPDCAQALADEAQVFSDRYQIGTWGRYTVVIQDQQSVFYRLNRSNRFSFWGDLEPAAVEEPVQEVPSGSGQDPDGDGFVGEADRCPNDPENINGVFDQDGCSDTIDDLIDFAVNDLNVYWEAATTELGYEYYPPRAVRAYSDPADASLAYNAFYSPSGHFIAYDIRLMERSLAVYGDLAPVAIMAHEWGHLSQRNLGIDREYTIQTELMADCLAGSYTTHLEEQGNLEEGDLEEGLRQMYAIGDSDRTPWFHPNAHGSSEQRYEAFLNGYEEGMMYCFETY